MVDAELLADICLSADDYVNKYNLETGDAWETTEQDVEAVVRKHLISRAAKPPITHVRRNGAFGVCGKCAALINMESAVSNATNYLPTRYCPNCGAKIEEN